MPGTIHSSSFIRVLPMFLLATLAFSGCSQSSGRSATYAPAPSVIRGDGELSIGWVQAGLGYEVWYGQTNNIAAARRWNGTINRSGIVAGTTITGLANGTAYYVWIKLQDGRVGMGTSGIPHAPPVKDDTHEGFVFVPGGTVIGSAAYAITVTVPNDPAFNFPGRTSTVPGVFVEGRTVPIEPFFMAKHEVTIGLWHEVKTAMGDQFTFRPLPQPQPPNPPIARPTPQNGNEALPMTFVCWKNAIIWSNAYSRMKGLQPVYFTSRTSGIELTNYNEIDLNTIYMNRSRNGFRLPTEVEREFAARGGDPGTAAWMLTFAGSNTADNVAWHNSIPPRRQLRNVGAKSENRLGIHDLSGNVQEWGWGWMNWNTPVTATTPVDGEPHGPGFRQKPMAGGGVGSNLTMSAVAYRWGSSPASFFDVVGFRVVRRAAP